MSLMDSLVTNAIETGEVFYEAKHGNLAVSITPGNVLLMQYADQLKLKPYPTTSAEAFDSIIALHEAVKTMIGEELTTDIISVVAFIAGAVNGRVFPYSEDRVKEATIRLPDEPNGDVKVLSIIKAVNGSVSKCVGIMFTTTPAAKALH